MLQAILLGIASQSSLVLSGLAVYWVKVPGKVIGCLAGFGAGALISAIAYDLIPEGEGLSLDRAGPLASHRCRDLRGQRPNRRVAVRGRCGRRARTPGDRGRVGGRWSSPSRRSSGSSSPLARGSAWPSWPRSSCRISPRRWHHRRILPKRDGRRAGWLACGGWFSSPVVSRPALATERPTCSGPPGTAPRRWPPVGLLAMLTNSLMPYAFEKGGAMAGVFTVVGFAVSMIGS